MSELHGLIRATWREAMAVRAARPRGIRRRPRDPDEALALRELSLRIGRRAFATRLVKQAPRVYRLIPSAGGR
ncbi:MAG: hypothetical protein QN152_06335 [Armatimonadota bacterium]|nr:hypothetical protein [Armatimonadota bacterium]MDR7470366.1 hypothetical protein [Armatimonadota bacterium]MDR7474087.1 hypothetical protein [Armatimonadota bacterium]MDR7539138.1 hypothetical protein [Armatimonadota bacterium]